MRESYRIVAERFGIDWQGRRYDRANPEAADLPNQAINHAATAVQAAAATAVAAVSALPQLGFIHEDSDQSFVLDVADLYRVDVILPVAFRAAKDAAQGRQTVDRLVRRSAARAFAEHKLVPGMIDRIKRLFGETT
jgi:CRISPR-associated protein Cas1